VSGQRYAPPAEQAADENVDENRENGVSPRSRLNTSEMALGSASLWGVIWLAR
jgi:hypothetical protein